ncbi:hypothetical protein HYW20_07245 [Candidatus Woesearchaeota archaeon]|nr:hypothetical protein [Candidatus Woesearchaeota archaeon]
MKQLTPNFLDWNNQVLTSSIKKINLNIILIVILDTLFYLLSGFLAIAWFQRIQTKIFSFNIPTDIVSLGYDGAQRLISEAKLFYYLIIGSFILLLVAIIFLASILKGIIWAKTTNTKININLISRFFGLNFIWMGFWFVIVILISLLIEPRSAPMFMIITIILGIYFTNTLYTIFMKGQKLKSITDAIKLNILKIHMFLLPYAVIFMLLFIILRLGNLLKFQNSSILTGLLVILYLAIVRYYASTLVLEVKDLK